MEVSGQLHAPAALLPGKMPPVPIEWEVGWIPEPVWSTWSRENSWPYRESNSNPSVVQAVASRCTDYAIPAPKFIRHTDQYHWKTEMLVNVRWKLLILNFIKICETIYKEALCKLDFIMYSYCRKSELWDKFRRIKLKKLYEDME
jgi:hypothetical protein